jgi:molybdopterin-binding protein
VADRTRTRPACFVPCYFVEMAEYRIGQAAELLGVSSDTVRRWAEAGRVKTTVRTGGKRYVDGADLARLATEMAGEQRRDNPRGASARNCILGVVTRVTKDGVAAQVEIQSGPHRFVALITREAADELELEPGMVADAVVKATNVGVEVPAEF